MNLSHLYPAVMTDSRDNIDFLNHSTFLTCMTEGNSRTSFVRMLTIIH